MFGHDISELGVHSYRKGAHSYMNSGSTAGPSGAATCIRGGHTMGAARDMCVLQERAGDGYCGCTLTGLPINKPEFAMSHPDFVPDLTNKTAKEIKQAKKKVKDQVRDGLHELFGHEMLVSFPTVMPFLRHGLASSLHHKLKTNGVRPSNLPIRLSPTP